MSGLPFPVVYAHTPSMDPDDLCVMVDDVGAGRLAAEHLMDVGRRRIAHISGPADFAAVAKRAKAFTRAVEEAGLRPVGGVRTGFWCEAWGREAANSIIAEYPDVDAIYCGSDLLARGAADALREAGRSVPDDIALVGTDNWRLIAESARPTLTTVDLNMTLVGRRAAEALVKAIDGNRGHGRLTVRATLVVRGSSGVTYQSPTKLGGYHESCIHSTP
jgi:LacI family transcriptional regulator